MNVHHETKSDGMRVHHKKERWGKSSPKERAMVLRVHHGKKSDGMTVHHQKERWRGSSP